MRGQEKGESVLRKKNLLGTLKSGEKDIGRDHANALSLAGFVAATFLFGISALSVTSAHAADRSWGNIDVAKKAIENVAPVISENKVDQNSASYVFASDSFIQKPLVTETQITVDPPKPRVVTRAVVAKKVVQPKVVAASTDTNIDKASAHRFPYGYCTYFVSEKRFVPWSGNAGTWLTGAIKFGYATGDTPKVGAIVVTSEGGYTGHVAMVDAVNSDGTITLSEMNYAGFGRTSSRTISTSFSAIKGYIY